MKTRLFVLLLSFVFGVILSACSKSNGETKLATSTINTGQPVRIEKLLKNVSENVQTIYGIAIVDKDDYWVSGETLRKTKDGGASWQTLPNFDSHEKISTVLFTNEKSGMVVLPSSLGITNDGGINWRFKKFENYIGGFSLSSGKSGKIYLYGKSPPIGDSPGIIYVSSNGGESWEKIFDSFSSKNWSNFTEPTSLVEFSSSDILVSFGNGRLLRSTNGGKSWSVPQNKIPELTTLILDQNKRLLGTGVLSGIYASEDNGESWKELKLSGDEVKNVRWKSICSLDKNGNLAVGDDGKIAISRNFGEDWVQVSNDVIGADELIDISCNSNHALLLGEDWLYKLFG